MPVNPDVLGTQAKQNQPQIEQLFVASSKASGDELERQLYLTRKRIERAIAQTKADWRQDFYICSFSTRTICL